MIKPFYFSAPLMLSKPLQSVSCAVIGCVSSGKVAVQKEDLQKYHGKDTWFQLQPASADSEVQVGALV